MTEYERLLRLRENVKASRDMVAQKSIPITGQYDIGYITAMNDVLTFLEDEMLELRELNK